MLCSKVLGNIHLLSPAPPEIDLVDFTWSECLRRSLHKRSRGGREIKILLPAGATLRDGDLLGMSGDVAVVVRALPGEVLVARPKNLQQMGLICFEIGNQHLPAEIREDEVIVARDEMTENLLRRLDVPFEPATRIFHPMPASGAHWAQMSDDMQIFRS